MVGNDTPNAQLVDWLSVFALQFPKVCEIRFIPQRTSENMNTPHLIRWIEMGYLCATLPSVARVQIA